MNDKDLKEYYLRNKRSCNLGNSPMWYAKDGEGYTAYILGAERFTEEKKDLIMSHCEGKYEPFLCSEVDKRLHLIFDIQDAERLGTDEPCPWSGGYAKRTDQAEIVALNEGEA